MCSHLYDGGEDVRIKLGGKKWGEYLEYLAHDTIITSESCIQILTCIVAWTGLTAVWVRPTIAASC